MKFKPLIASMCALGVTSFVLASTAYAGGHELEAMKNKIAKMEAVLDQNQGQAYSFAHLPLNNWQNRLTVSGLLNVDAAYSSRTPAAGTGGRFPAANNTYLDVDVANANLYFDAEVNCYTTTHVSVNYYGNANRRNDVPWGNAAAWFVDEAYATISNFAETPVYLRVGEQYFDFGHYHRYYITAPMTYLFTATRNDGATLGFNSTNGFNGSVYVLQGMNSATAAAGRVHLNNGGIHVGYMGSSSGMGYNVSFDYIAKLFDTNMFASGLATYTSRVGGWNLHGSMVYHQWDGSLDYAAASSRANVADWTFGAAGAGAKPRTFGLDVGYTFAAGGLPSRVGFGYQRSWEMVGITSATYAALPRSRFLVQYGVELGRNTDLTFQLVNDKDYPTTDTGTIGGGAATPGTNRTTTSGIARLSVRFA